jgi:hypothetical protein
MNSANQIGEYYQILLTKKKKKKDNQIQYVQTAKTNRRNEMAAY